MGPMHTCTQVFKLKPMTNPHPVLGNGQHIGVSALVLAAALMSVEFFDVSLGAPAASTVNANLSIRQQAGLCWRVVRGCSFVCIPPTGLFSPWTTEPCLDRKPCKGFACRSKRHFPKCKFAKTMLSSKLETSSEKRRHLEKEELCVKLRSHSPSMRGLCRIQLCPFCPVVSLRLRVWSPISRVRHRFLHIEIYIQTNSDSPMCFRAQLKDKCEEAKLKKTGNIPELKSRLLEHCCAQIDEDNVEQTLCCFCVRCYACQKVPSHVTASLFCFLAPISLYLCIPAQLAYPGSRKGFAQWNAGGSGIVWVLHRCAHVYIKRANLRSHI